MNTEKLRKHSENLQKISKKLEAKEDFVLSFAVDAARMDLDHMILHAENDQADERKELLLAPKRYNGYFTQTDNRMIVTDPCYSLNTWCQHVLEGVLPGKWMTTHTLKDEDQWGVRVSEIAAFVGEEPSAEAYILEEMAHIGVDSGQAGFFDYAMYEQAKIEEDALEADGKNAYNVPDSFYRNCCNRTLGSMQSGVVDQGFVSSSGYGDGSYNLYTVRNEKGLVVAVKVVFIGDEADEEE